ncbi:peptidase S24/S26A/S26B/S26C family protein [Striga asiatica]|uniref:Peptidase S24/S26A/S26B/S26C family protein n=1 Tax=Striga asiatica TaxID=4170 RepID=A0A5A7PMT0_STRAF|nr:peptidase S24/S26A/S26B/S26C family protein [Striga asiatica]
MLTAITQATYPGFSRGSILEHKRSNAATYHGIAARKNPIINLQQNLQEPAEANATARKAMFSYRSSFCNTINCTDFYLGKPKKPTGQLGSREHNTETVAGRRKLQAAGQAGESQSQSSAGGWRRPGMSRMAAAAEEVAARGGDDGPPFYPRS